jgi:hypothetical protein
MPLTSITGEETNLAEIQANGHNMCTYEIHVDASARVSAQSGASMQVMAPS